MMFHSNLLTAVILSLLSGLPSYADATSKVDYLNHAMNATSVLNRQWYNRSTGLWQELWWNSGATLATIGDVVLINDEFRSTATGMLSDILVAAKAFNGGSFLNQFFDDEGWWAMGWIKAYDVTKDTKYLAAAQDIFKDMLTGQKAKCGGIWWSKDKAYNAAIANQLFLAVAASLANRVGGHQYREIAQKQVDWLLSSGMVNGNSTFNDGLNVLNCKRIGDVFSYNQGVILLGLIEMQKLTGE